MTIEKKTIVKDYKNILDNMKEIDNHYCFNCKSNFYFLKMIEIDNEMNYVCPYCYSKDFVDKSYMIKEITVNKFEKNTRYGNLPERKNKQKNIRFRKTIYRMILYTIYLCVCMATFSLGIFGLLFLVYNKYKKRYVKNNYPNLYKMRYGVD